jgi:lipopolysaccharide transport system permease protein
MKEKILIKEKEDWDLVLRPQASLLDLHLVDIWRYRDLLVLFIKRDFVAQYKQTILGPVWHLVQPILTTLVFLLLFGRIAHIPTDGIQPILFYMSGITLWNYFSICFTSTSNTFVNNASIFGKVYFPRLILPLSIVLSNLIRLGIQFGLLLAVMIWFNFHGYPIHIGLSWVWIPVLVALMAGLGLGLGIIISSLATKYRDFTILMGFVVQLWMYVTPVGYPMSYLANSKYHLVIKLNPLSSIVESFRYALFGKGFVPIHGLMYSFGIMIVSLFMGILIFSRVERSFMDTV